MRDYYIVGLIFFILLFSLTAFSQVTIGSLEKPEEYATLKIDGENRGLRISRLTTKQRNDLFDENDVTAKKQAQGLLIYNKETSNLEFFDGSVWKLLPIPNGAKNGVTMNTATNNELWLGGRLEEETSIKQNKNSLSFGIGANSEGSFIVSADTDTNFVEVNKNNVIFDNLSTFTINTGANDAVKIVGTAADANNTVDLNIGDRGTLDVNDGTLNIEDRTIRFGGSFTYKDGNQAKDRALFMETSEGQATWKDIQPRTIRKSFVITGETTVNTGMATSTALPSPQSGSLNVVSNSLLLESGKWLITGTFFTFSPATTSNRDLGAVVIQIVDADTGDILYMTGSVPEIKDTKTVYSAASVSCYVDVPEGTTKNILVKARGHNTQTYMVKGGSSSDFHWLDPKGRGCGFTAMKVQN